jgi:hypothetical protein
VKVITYYPYFVPTYLVTRSRVVVAAQVVTASAATGGLSNAALIAIVCGSAVILALMTAALVALIRKGRKVDAVSSDVDELYHSTRQTSATLTIDTADEGLLADEDGLSSVSAAVQTYGDDYMFGAQSFDPSAEHTDGIWL